MKLVNEDHIIQQLAEEWSERSN